MAHKKGVGSTDNGRDSNPKFLGVKLFGGQYAKAGNIIVRQRGTKFHPGNNVYMGRDHTLHAKIEGYVNFETKKKGRTYVNILPMDGDGGAAVKSPKARKAEAQPKAATPKKATPAKASAPAAPAAPAPKAEAITPATPAVGGKPDKLTKIEGIGPKIAEHLGAAGIITFSDLAAAPVGRLKEILEAAGPRYRVHIPDTWPQQSKLAAEGKWDELKVLQDKLDGGRPEAKGGEEE